MLNSKEADFILRGDGEVIYPEIAKDELELYYDVKGKKNGDIHKNKLLDMSGQGKDGELTGFDYAGELSGYDGDNGLVFDGFDDTLKMPKLSGLDANNFTYQLNNNILAFTGDEVKTVKNGDVEVGGRNYLRNSDFSSGLDFWGAWTGSTISNKNGNLLIEYKGQSATNLGAVQSPRLPVGDYTISAKIKRSSNDITTKFQIGSKNDYEPELPPVGKWGVITSHLKDTGGNFYIYRNNSGATGTLEVEWIKLEKGNKATDWTPAPEDLIRATELKRNILGDMEDIVDASPRDRQSGKEVFTEHADNSHVEVEVDGQSYQHAGSGKNLFVPVRLKTNHSIKENSKLINTIGSQIFYPIESPKGVYTASFSYQHNLNYAPIFMTFYYSDGSSDGNSHGYLDSTSQIRKEMTSNSAKKVVGVGYNAPTVIGVEWGTNPDPNMTRYGLALDTGVKTIGVSWDMESNPSMIRSGGLI